MIKRRSLDPRSGVRPGQSRMTIDMPRLPTYEPRHLTNKSFTWLAFHFGDRSVGGHCNMTERSPETISPGCRGLYGCFWYVGPGIGLDSRSSLFS